MSYINRNGNIDENIRNFTDDKKTILMLSHLMVLFLVTEANIFLKGPQRAIAN
jgi:hypothetical protein